MTILEKRTTVCQMIITDDRRVPFLHAAKGLDTAKAKRLWSSDHANSVIARLDLLFLYQWRRFKEDTFVDLTSNDDLNRFFGQLTEPQSPYVEMNFRQMLQKLDTTTTSSILPYREYLGILLMWRHTIPNEAFEVLEDQHFQSKDPPEPLTQFLANFLRQRKDATGSQPTLAPGSLPPGATRHYFVLPVPPPATSTAKAASATSNYRYAAGKVLPVETAKSKATAPPPAPREADQPVKRQRLHQMIPYRGASTCNPPQEQPNPQELSRYDRDEQVPHTDRDHIIPTTPPSPNIPTFVPTDEDEQDIQDPIELQCTPQAKKKNTNILVLSSTSIGTRGLWVRGGLEISWTASPPPPLPPGQKAVPPNGNLIAPIPPQAIRI